MWHFQGILRKLDIHRMDTICTITSQIPRFLSEKKKVSFLWEIEMKLRLSLKRYLATKLLGHIASPLNSSNPTSYILRPLITKFLSLVSKQVNVEEQVDSKISLFTTLFIRWLQKLLPLMLMKNKLFHLHKSPMTLWI